MGKAKKQYVCSNCGSSFRSWAGKCSSCNEWNTLSEQLDISTVNVKAEGTILETASLVAEAKASEHIKRFKTGDGQFDEVLGGGIVKGSVVLIAGQPGIGKSTILLQVAHGLSHAQKVLYVSGEESAHQVASRAMRLGLLDNEVAISATTSTDNIARTIASSEYDVVIVDSIQTTATESVSSAPGSVSQISNSTQLITKAAKQTDTALIIVGHVTKDGSIAGPKVLEHSVDCVLQLEGDRYGGFKILRTIKNRFGSTNEAAMYEMEQNGLQPVKNPSAALLAERQNVDGSVVLATLEGTRAVLVEIQALVNKTSYGYPKRTASGFDLNRLNLLIAVLERRTKLTLQDSDVYINVVGGLTLDDPAADLAVAMAVASAAKGLVLGREIVVFGEIGLGGEVRHVSYIDKRIAEAKKLRFTSAIGPEVKSGKSAKELHSVKSLREALNTFLKS